MIDDFILDLLIRLPQFVVTICYLSHEDRDVDAAKQLQVRPLSDGSSQTDSAPGSSGQIAHCVTSVSGIRVVAVSESSLATTSFVPPFEPALNDQRCRRRRERVRHGLTALEAQPCATRSRNCYLDFSSSFRDRKPSDISIGTRSEEVC